MTTRLVLVLDRSGSMSGLEKDVIGGFNSFISEQKKLEDEATVTTILFDNHYEILHKNVKLQKVKPITTTEYFTRVDTALLDALGKTIKLVDSYTKSDDIVLFVINTDGKENCSQEFDTPKIKEMVKHFEEEHDWKFIFLGANIDAFSVGGSMGINHNFNYANTREGVLNLYDAVTYTASAFRTTKGKNLDVTQLVDLDKKKE